MNIVMFAIVTNLMLFAIYTELKSINSNIQKEDKPQC